MDPVRLNPNGTVEILDLDAVPFSAWQKFSDYMTEHGYDWRGGEDAKELMRQRGTRGQIVLEGDHAKGMQYALGIGPAQQKPKPKKLSPRTLQKVVNHFGLTNDLREAGFILPNGSLLDLSGKNDGGTPGIRARDHREIGFATGSGGTAGMIEFQQAGSVRIGGNNIGTIDMETAPTEPQLSVIAQICRRHQGEVTVTMCEGRGWDKIRDMPVGGRQVNKDYSIGTNPAVILNNIRKFYGMRLAAWIRKNCRFAQAV
jgi:hypothetical protein